MKTVQRKSKTAYKTPARKPARKNIPVRTSKPPKRRNRWLSILRWPSWAVWIGGLVMLFIYAFVFYHFFVSPYSFRWKGIFGEQKYPAGYSIHGIDISHHQGEINWERLRNATIDNSPIRFIFIKATEGVDFLDENFNDNFYQAKDNNFIRGA